MIWIKLPAPGPGHPGSMDAPQIIAGCRLFARLEPAAKEKLAAMAVVRRLPPREMIFRQGDQVPGVYIVGSGLVRVFKLGASGKEHVLHLAGPGKTFAEAAAIAGFACPANAETVEDSVLCLLPEEPFAAFLQADHASTLAMLASMAMWLHHVIDLLEDVVLRDAAGRLARHLIESAGATGVVELASSRKHLASHLNLTPETLSRTQRRLIDDGLIRQERDQLTIVDLAGLAAVAELTPKI